MAVTSSPFHVPTGTPMPDATLNDLDIAFEGALT